jgi:tRNA G46 methylase TrmB
MIMAKTYPNSTFYGFDYHTPSYNWLVNRLKRKDLQSIELNLK